MNYLEVAREYAEYGLTLVPITEIIDESDGGKKRKGCFIKKWTTLPTERILRHTFWKNAVGVGLRLGACSGVVCLDMDFNKNTEKGQALYAEILSYLPPARCSLAGAKHKYPAMFFKFNGERGQKFPNIDVELLSSGNQKVIAPSRHNDGHLYEWVGESIMNCFEELPEIPSELLEFLAFKNEMEAPNKEDSDSIYRRVTLEAAENRCKHGSHNHLSKIGVAKFFEGVPFDELVDLLLSEDKLINKDSDFLYFNCPSRPWKTKDKMKNAHEFVGEIFKNNASKKMDYFRQLRADGFTERETTDNGKVKIIRKYDALHGYFKELYSPYYVAPLRSFFLWEKNRYVRHDERIAKVFAQNYFKNPSLTSVGERNTFFELLRSYESNEVSDFILSDKEKINFRNGTYCLRSKRLREHDKADKMTYIINHDLPLKEQATPVWDTLLDHLTCEREHFKDLIHEYIGYILSGASYERLNKVLILDGGGSNGKSTLVKIIEKIVCAENISSVSLTDIATNRFSGSGLVNKLLNICSEEPKEAFANTSPLKKLTGNDLIAVEEKHRDRFYFTNIAKFIISYNKIPYLPDDSAGLKRRLIILPFDQNYETNPEKKIENVVQKVSSEIGGIIFKSLKAYHAVLNRGAFTEIPEGVERLNYVLEQSNPVLSFVSECLEIGRESDFVRTDKIYEWFCKYNEGGKIYSKIGFSRSLNECLINTFSKQFSSRESQLRGYKCLKLKEKWKDLGGFY